MKNLLKKLWGSDETETLVVEKPKVDWEKVNKGDRSGLFQRKKTTEELIQEIHDTFYTEVDRLLEFAKIQKPIETTEEQTNIVVKANKLKRLGFSKTKEVAISKEIVKNEKKIKTENETKQQLIETINYFSTKYPQYKFITEESVKKICQKYNLIYGTVDRYQGNVPDKNLSEIEKFVIDENDCSYQEKIIIRDSYSLTMRESYKYFNKETYDKKVVEKETFSHMKHDSSSFMYVRLENSRNSIISKCPFEIAAPKDDFDTDGMQITDSKLEKAPVKIPDPIVLQPVFHNGQKHYLIVTAWGLEASDELVVNHRMN